MRPSVKRQAEEKRTPLADQSAMRCSRQRGGGVRSTGAGRRSLSACPGGARILRAAVPTPILDATVPGLGRPGGVGHLHSGIGSSPRCNAPRLGPGATRGARPPGSRGRSGLFHRLSMRVERLVCLSTGATSAAAAARWQPVGKPAPAGAGPLALRRKGGGFEHGGLLRGLPQVCLPSSQGCGQVRSAGPTRSSASAAGGGV